MREFIDKTSEQSGTPINRGNLMAMQGFQPATVEYKCGEQVITYSNGHQLRSKVDDNVITEIFIGEKTITKVTTINYENMSRQEVVE